MQKVGTYLLMAGIIVAIGYAMYSFFTVAFQTVPLPLKAAITAAVIGFLFILTSLIRERVKTSKVEKEKFKGVDK